MQESLVNQTPESVATVPESMPTINPAAEIFFNEGLFNRVKQLASMMASGSCAIPNHLKGKAGDCFAVITQAIQWRMNPFAVAQKTHIVNGTLGYEAQLVNAVVNTCAPVKDQFHYEFFGDWENVIGKFETRTGKSGSEYQKAAWKAEDEKGVGVRVWATLRGETEPRELRLLLSQATVRNSTLWAGDPQQQLGYLAVKRWARRYCPAAIMGVYTADELDETHKEVRNVTPGARSKAEKLDDFLSGPEAETVDANITEPKPEFKGESISVDDIVKAYGIPKAELVEFFQRRGSIKASLSELTQESRRWMLDNVGKTMDQINAWKTGTRTDTDGHGQARTDDVITPAQMTRLFALMKEHGKSEAYTRRYLLEIHDVSSFKSIKVAIYDEVCNWVATGANPRLSAD